MFNTPGWIKSRDIELLTNLNEAMERLKGSRNASIDASAFADAKLAWKVAMFREVMLYRVVALGEASALMWNAENVIGGYLVGRSIVETVAVLLDLEHELDRLLELNDFTSIDAIVTNRIFATRDKGWSKDSPDTAAINILTFVDKMDKRGMEGTRRIYDVMSEYCHPNYSGHHGLFSTLDTQTGGTTFSTSKYLTELHRPTLLSSITLLMLAEHTFDHLAVQISEIQALHR